MFSRFIRLHVFMFHLYTNDDCQPKPITNIFGYFYPYTHHPWEAMQDPTRDEHLRALIQIFDAFGEVF